jgi:hypothetical protein
LSNGLQLRLVHTDVHNNLLNIVWCILLQKRQPPLKIILNIEQQVVKTRTRLTKPQVCLTMFALAVGVYQIQTNPISTFAQAEHQEPCNRRSSESKLRQYLQLTQLQKLTAETSCIIFL